MLYMDNKKAISPMIGYILLITFAVIIGTVVFQWMKTYVPRDVAECPDEVSLFIKNYNYNCALDILNVTLINNGKFNIGGYFIRATNSTEESLASKDLSNFSIEKTIGNLIKFPGIENSFKPGNPQKTNKFNLSNSGFGRIYSIEIVPARWQVENNKKILVICTNAKTKELVYCS